MPDASSADGNVCMSLVPPEGIYNMYKYPLLFHRQPGPSTDVPPPRTSVPPLEEAKEFSQGRKAYLLQPRMEAYDSPGDLK